MVLSSKPLVPDRPLTRMSFLTFAVPCLRVVCLLFLLLVDCAPHGTIEQFSQYGDITSVILRVKHIGEDIRTWAFVEYGSSEMVAPAITGSESLELGGVPCTVEARKSTPTPR